jgi:molybdate-binding protein/DNA-binding XRE family transcriptional regulator
MSGVEVPGRGRRLRLARLAGDLSQEQLARAAGVTRQAVAGVEAGSWDPSLQVALAIARALGTSVEELFGEEHAPEILPATVVRSDRNADVRRLQVAQVGPKLVGFELVADRAFSMGFVPASGLAAGPAEGEDLRAVSPGARSPGSVEPGVFPVRPLGALRPTLTIAGCDPAIPLLGPALARLEPSVDLVWWPCSSRAALDLLAAGLVHVAGAHVSDPSTGSYNLEAARGGLGETGARVVTFARWREGLVLSPQISGSVAGLEDLVVRGATFVNRERGSEARALLEREQARIGIGNLRSGPTVGGHLLVASAVAAGVADAGVASEPSALAYGLGFVPLSEERYDLVVPEPLVSSSEVKGLLRVLAGSWIRDQLAAIAGYEPSECGTVVESF